MKRRFSQDTLRSLLARLTSPSEQLINNWLAHALLFVVVFLASLHFVQLTPSDMMGSIAFRWANLTFLPFHEAGHLFFGLFGDFIGSLGGTLGQMLMPLICLVAFLRKGNDTFAAAVCFWWFALNFLNIAPYIGDARDGVLPLLGGNYGHSSPYGFHDWEYLLTELGLIQFDDAIAAGSTWLGRVLIAVACYWMFLLLKRAKAHR